MKKYLSVLISLLFILSFFGIASILAATGGPDNFGYTFIDSNDDPLLQSYYPWIEIKGIGAPATYSYCLIGNCDDCYKIDVPLGFNFNYYGTNYNKVNIMSNGWINFNVPGIWFQTTTFPHNDPYIDPISVYGRDLYPCCNDSFVYYATVMRGGRRVFVVEYYQVPDCCGCGETYERHTFQVQLYEGLNNIVFVYKTTSGDAAFIGIEGKDQTDGLTYMAVGDPGDGTVVLFRYPGSPQYPPQKQIPITQILKILKENQED